MLVIFVFKKTFVIHIIVGLKFVSFELLLQLVGQFVIIVVVLPRKIDSFVFEEIINLLAVVHAHEGAPDRLHTCVQHHAGLFVPNLELKPCVAAIETHVQQLEVGYSDGHIIVDVWFDFVHIM